jgi:hypothetical protein
MYGLRLAVRSLRATPIVTLVALLTLALGIGANTAIFSFIYGLLLAPMPYQHPERLVSLWEQTPSGRRNAMTTLNYVDYAQSPGIRAGRGNDRVLRTCGPRNRRAADPSRRLSCLRVIL